VHRRVFVCTCLLAARQHKAASSVQDQGVLCSWQVWRHRMFVVGHASMQGRQVVVWCVHCADAASCQARMPQQLAERLMRWSAVVPAALAYLGHCLL
jgi:hypothetical protein